jgi:hypothetical protein
MQKKYILGFMAVLLMSFFTKAQPLAGNTTVGVGETHRYVYYSQYLHLNVV